MSTPTRVPYFLLNGRLWFLEQLVGVTVRDGVDGSVIFSSVHPFTISEIDPDGDGWWVCFERKEESGSFSLYKIFVFENMTRLELREV